MSGTNLDAMTSTERAHAIVERAVVRTYNLHASEEYNRQCTVEDIVAALLAERQAVWEEAARCLDEEDCLTSSDELDSRCKVQCFGILGRFSTKFRQRAKEEVK